MNKDELMEEIDDLVDEISQQPWGNVLCTVFLIGLGQIVGFFTGWLVFG